ncbi:MAG TPA: HAD family phosphatase [Hanamia sp.]|nr:HAD family phosphatase [Hanamia sp.]
MEKIENIIFDLGGVLLDIDYNRTRYAFENLGIADFDQMYSQTDANQLFQKLETGKISDDDFYKELNRCTGLNLSPGEIRNAWNAMLVSFRESSLKFLNGIRPKYKIFLLSNTNYIHLSSFNEIFHNKKREKSFEEYFDRAFYSCTIGLRKPDTTCYEWVINELGIDANKTLFIDDSELNIEGAKKTGLQTILLTPEKRIENLGL